VELEWGWVGGGDGEGGFGGEDIGGMWKTGGTVESCTDGSRAFDTENIMGSHYVSRH
jgi:hypothetical protein